MKIIMALVSMAFSFSAHAFSPIGEYPFISCSDSLRLFHVQVLKQDEVKETKLALFSVFNQLVLPITVGSLLSPDGDRFYQAQYKNERYNLVIYSDYFTSAVNSKINAVLYVYGQEGIRETELNCEIVQY